MASLREEVKKALKANESPFCESICPDYWLEITEGKVIMKMRDETKEDIQLFPLLEMEDIC